MSSTNSNTNKSETYQDDKVVTKSKTIKKLDKIVAKKKLDIMLDIQMTDGRINSQVGF